MTDAPRRPRPMLSAPALLAHGSVRFMLPRSLVESSPGRAPLVQPLRWPEVPFQVVAESGVKSFVRGGVEVEPCRTQRAPLDLSSGALSFRNPTQCLRSAHGRLADLSSAVRLGADQAIACPCRVTAKTRTGQGITSLSELNIRHDTSGPVVPRSCHRSALLPGGGPARSSAADTKQA
jgi:hypothetical protein